ADGNVGRGQRLRGRHNLELYRFVAAGGERWKLHDALAVVVGLVAGRRRHRVEDRVALQPAGGQRERDRGRGIFGVVVQQDGQPCRGARFGRLEEFELHVVQLHLVGGRQRHRRRRWWGRLGGFGDGRRRGGRRSRRRGNGQGRRRERGCARG